MTDLLTLIENCDPSDEKALDEIDAKVWAFLNLDNNFTISFNGGAIYYRHDTWPADAHTVLHHSFQHPQYARSRDALKAIRPKGWMFNIKTFHSVNGLAFGSSGWKGKYEEKSVGSTIDGKFPTEELAELHAIIQALTWERENGMA